MASAKRAGAWFDFTARLEQVPGGGPFFVAIPAAVSKAIGRRGVVPIVALVAGVAEVRASIVPAGGGRHRLRLNAAAREQAEIARGDRVAIRLRVDDAPVAEPTPPDLARALRDAGVLDLFESFPVGHRSHVVKWIVSSAKDETRARRIDKCVAYALERRESGVDPRFGRRRSR